VHTTSGADVLDGGRDRFIDLVRVGALATVVLLHWLSVMPSVTYGRFSDHNVVAVVPALWPLTWLGDVMALFFFAGGYANWVSMQGAHERGEPVSAYLEKRFRRLATPAIGFVGTWFVADLLMDLVGLRRWSPLSHVSLGNTTPFGPLWFLGVYLCIVALSPVTAVAHRRWGIAVPVAMALGVFAADLVSFMLGTGTPMVANLFLVWSIPHQLGYFYADGRLRRLRAAGSAGMAVTGLLALVVLTSLPFYPRNLLGPHWKVLTTNAATLPLVAQGVCMVGVAMLCRRPVLRLVRRSWSLLSHANRWAMPVYLWHMTAYLMAVVVLSSLGMTSVTTAHPSASWWLARPVVMVVSGALLVALLAVTATVGRLAARANRVPLSLRDRRAGVS
jgi:hypothetical protein